MPSKTAQPHVLIVGAGLGGLTLAQCLRKQGISFEIFERDVNDYSRPQGWAIGLHMMLDALESSAPSDMPDLRASTHHLLPLTLNSQICMYYKENGSRIGVQDTPYTPGGEHIQISYQKPLEESLSCLVDEITNSDCCKCLRANRTRLRDWLSRDIPIQWGKRVESVENTDDGVSIRFEDGATATGDILIGADGVNSIVREHLLQRPNSDVLNLIPTAIIIGEMVLSGAAMERQLSLGHSSYIVNMSDTQLVLFVGLNQVSDDGNSGEYYWLITMLDDKIGEPDHWLQTASKEKRLEYAKTVTASLDPKFREIIEMTPASGVHDTPFLYRDAEITSLPAGRMVLLGDAAHPMTPFRGEGGVHAITDALKLSKVLGRVDLTNAEATTAAVARYHAEVLERGVEAVKRSRTAHTNKNSVVMAWGHPAEPIPEENISLSSLK